MERRRGLSRRKTSGTATSGGWPTKTGGASIPVRRGCSISSSGTSRRGGTLRTTAASTVNDPGRRGASLDVSGGGRGIRTPKGRVARWISTPLQIVNPRSVRQRHRGTDFYCRSTTVADHERYTASPRKVWRRAGDSNSETPCGVVDFKTTQPRSPTLRHSCLRAELDRPSPWLTLGQVASSWMPTGTEWAPPRKNEIPFTRRRCALSPAYGPAD